MKTDRESAIEILTDAWDRIADSQHWTQNAFAISKSGLIIGTCSPKAVAWCSHGSLARSQGMYHTKAGLTAQKQLKKSAIEMGYHGIADLNDSVSHEDVALMFKRAITSLEENNG